MPDIIGSEDRDTLWGVAGTKNLLLGLGGDDTLHGQGLADHLEGGRGDDWLYGAPAAMTRSSAARVMIS